MEVFKVFGKQIVDFFDRSGKHVEGISLHCTTSVLPSDKWQGLAYEKLWCPVGNPVNSQALAVPVGSEIQVDFGRNGKPVSIVVKEETKDPKERR